MQSECWKRLFLLLLTRCRGFDLRPVAEVLKSGFAVAAGAEGGADVEEVAEDVVVHGADFCRGLGFAPECAGKTVAGIEFLTVVEDAPAGGRGAGTLRDGDDQPVH